MLKLIILFLLVSISVCEVCDVSIDITNGTLLRNGDIVHNDFKYTKHEYFKRGNSIRGCICNKKRCLLKCCPFGYGYDMRLKECVATSRAFEPPVYDNYANLQNIKITEHFHFNFSKPRCATDEIRVEIKQVFTDIHLTKVSW